MPTLFGDSPENLEPLWKNFNFAKSETSGFVKKKIITKSIIVVMPSVKANPLTLPIETTYKTIDEIPETKSATTVSYTHLRAHET